MKMVLETGHGGKPMGCKCPLDFSGFVRNLPKDVEYHGVDVVPPYKDEGQFAAFFNRSYLRDFHPSLHWKLMEVGLLEPRDMQERRAVRMSTAGWASEDFQSIRESANELLQLEWDTVKRDSLRMADAAAEFRFMKPANVFLHTMDSRRLAFRDGTFDEVHMNYVVTDPRVRDMLPEMMAEASRVLRLSGSLVITGELMRFGLDGKERPPEQHESRELALSEIRKAGFSILHASLDYADTKALRRATALSRFFFMKRDFAESMHGKLGDYEFIITAEK
jgi:hypothetical protein